MADLRRVIEVIVKDEQLDQHIRKVRQSGEEATKSAGKLDTAIASVGRSARVWIAGAVASAFASVTVAIAAATRGAARFEQELAGVRKTTGLSRVEIQALGRDLLSMSGRLGVSRSELASIAEVAGQLGIQGTSNIVAFTETIAQMTRVAELSADEAAPAIARIANAFSLPVTEATNLGSVLNELSNTTTATVRDIVDALGQIGNSGAAIGLTVDQVSALVASVIDSGVNVGRVGTQLRNTFTILQTKMDEVATVAGVTRQEFADLVSRDALGALNLYLDGLRKLPPQLQTIKINETFGQENLSSVQALARQAEILATNVTTASTAFREGTSLQKEFQIATDTALGRWNRLQSRITGMFIELGTRILPAVNRGLQGLLDFMDQFDSPARRLINTLREMGADSEIILKLEAAEALRQARETKRQLEEEMASKPILVSMQVQSVLRPGARPGQDQNVLQPQFGTISFDNVTVEELQRQLELVETQIASLGDEFENLEGKSGDQVAMLDAQRKGLIEVRRSILQGIETLEAYALATEQANQTLEATQQALREVNEESSDPPLDPERLKAAEQLIAKILQMQKEALALTGAERRALGELFTLRQLLADLRSVENAESRAGFREAERFLLEEIAKREEQLTQFDKLREAAKAVARSVEELALNLSGDALRGTKNLEREMAKLEKTVTAVATGTEQFASSLEAIAGLFGGIVRLADVFGDLSDEVRELARGTDDALRGLLRIAEARQQFGSRAGIGNPFEASATQVSGAAALGQIGAIVGLVTGAVSIARSLSNLGEEQKRRSAEERRRQEEMIRHLKELSRALEASRKAFQDAVDSALGSGIVGGGIKPEDLTKGRDIVSRIEEELRRERESPEPSPRDPENRSGGGARGETGRGRTGGDRDGGRTRGGVPVGGRADFFRDLAEEFDLLEIFDFDVSEFFDQLIEKYGGDIDKAIHELLTGMVAPGFEATRQGFEGLSSAMDKLEESFGQYSSSLAGAIQAHSDWIRFFGHDSITAGQNFIGFLLENVEGLSREAIKLLDVARRQDLTSEHGRKILQQIIEMIVKGGAALLGEGFTDQDARDIADVLLEALRAGERMGPVEEEEAPFTSSLTNLRQFTQAQGAELVFIAIAQLGVLEDIRDALTGRTGFHMDPRLTQTLASVQSPPSPLPASVTGGSVVNSFGDVIINAPWTDREAMIRQLASDFERELRRRLP